MELFKKITVPALILALFFSIVPGFTFAKVTAPTATTTNYCAGAKQGDWKPEGLTNGFKITNAKSEPTGNNTYKNSTSWTYDSESGMAKLKEYISKGTVTANDIIITVNGKNTSTSAASNSNFIYSTVITTTTSQTNTYDISQKICYAQGGQFYYSLLTSDQPIKITINPGGEPTIEPTITTNTTTGETTVGTEIADKYGYADCVNDRSKNCWECCDGKKKYGVFTTMAYVECYLVCNEDKTMTGIFNWIVDSLTNIIYTAIGII